MEEESNIEVYSNIEVHRKNVWSAKQYKFSRTLYGL